MYFYSNSTCAVCDRDRGATLRLRGGGHICDSILGGGGDKILFHTLYNLKNIGGGPRAPRPPSPCALQSLRDESNTAPFLLMQEAVRGQI